MSSEEIIAVISAASTLLIVPIFSFMNKKSDKNDEEIKELLVSQGKQIGEIVKHNAGQDEKIERLMGFSMDANRCRVVAQCEKLENILKTGKTPQISDILVFQKTFEEYQTMGGNGVIKERVEKIHEDIKKLEESEKN